MRLNQFIFLLGSTVILGAFMGVLTSATGIWLHVPWFKGLISGAFLATTSLMGFWAYLTLNFIARITIPRRVWRWSQALIVVVVLYDMVFWRYQLDVAHNPTTHASHTLFVVQALWPLVVSAVGAWLKRRQSGTGSFLPALFYLYVFTVVDWLLVIRAETGAIVNQTGIIMMTCNLYMALIYAKLLSPPAEVDKLAGDTSIPGRQNTPAASAPQK